MTRSICVCLLVAAVAAPGVSFPSISTPDVPALTVAMEATHDASFKPGKSKKYKKKMSKQMSKRKRH